jgi:L-arabinokinase
LRARRRFGVPEQAVVVLLSFGGFGLRRLPWRKITDSREFFFVTTDAHAKSEKNLVVLPEALVHYEDLVRAADVVVSKPGYGIVADVIAHRVPLLYTDRGFFPEHPYLVKMLEERATSEFIPQADLLAGNLDPYLKRLLLKTPHWPEVRLDGGEVAAETLLGLIG